MVKIGILGVGTVGTSVAKILEENAYLPTGTGVEPDSDAE